MKSTIKVEKECTGYQYTGENDDDRSNWSVETGYQYGHIYLTPPDEEADLEEFKAFAKAILAACKDMKAASKCNREEI